MTRWRENLPFRHRQVPGHPPAMGDSARWHSVVARTFLHCCPAGQSNRDLPFWLSSGRSTGSDWFEDWSKANDMAASVYVALTMESLCSHHEQRDASGQSQGCPRFHVLKIASASSDQGPAHRETAGRKPRTSASQKPHNRKSSPMKPSSCKSAVSGFQSQKSNRTKKPLAGGNAQTPLVSHDSLLTDFDRSK
jgi:hypothetical protein